VEFTLSQIAARLGASVEGGADPVIRGVAGVRAAAADEVAFVSQARYANDAARSGAGALLVGLDWATPLPMPFLRVAKPEAAFGEVARWFAPPTTAPAPGLHPTAVIDSTAVLGEGVSIGPHVVIGAQARVGARTVLGAGVVIAQGVEIGEDCLFHPLSSVREHCRIGNRVIVHNGAVIGSDGFGYYPDRTRGWVKIPQIGIVVIGDDVELGANVTVDRARFGRTIIGRGVKVDNLCQLAHNVIIGDHTAMAAQTGIAGSTIVGQRCQFAGQSGVAGHVRVGDDVVVGAQSAVIRDTQSGSRVFGTPARPQKEAAISFANVARLPELKQRIVELEKRLAALERASAPPPA
jgi:UDP-3-O-[3-hydroxymyristoyl] glucosamine N-acyltransferase